MIPLWSVLLSNVISIIIVVFLTRKYMERSNVINLDKPNKTNKTNCDTCKYLITKQYDPSLTCVKYNCL